MTPLHCPECGQDLDPTRDTSSCPHCGAPLHAPASTDLIIDVRAHDAHTGPAEEPVQAQPVFEERTYTGRAWPGGPQIFGKTIIFQSGSPIDPAQGRGCCACGCLLLFIATYIFIEGLRAIF